MIYSEYPVTFYSQGKGIGSLNGDIEWDSIRLDPGSWRQYHPLGRLGKSRAQGHSTEPRTWFPPQREAPFRFGAFSFQGVDLYRTVDTATWTDPKVKSVNPSAKLLFIYLITNPHSHVSGIYYLPMYDIHHETGLNPRQLKASLDTLSGLGLCHFDTANEVIWVRNMFFYQGRGEKNQRAAANQLNNLHKSHLIKDFLGVYPEVKSFISARLLSKLDRVSRSGIPDQEQDQEQDILRPPGLADQIKEIFLHWNSLPNVTHHEDLNPDTRAAIKTRIGKGYTPVKILAVMQNYNKLCGNGHAPGYGKWSLLELMRSVKYFDPLLSNEWEGFQGKEEKSKLAEDRGLYEHGWSERKS